MPRILMIDNQDSFFWNLVRYLTLADAETDVWRCDKIVLDPARLAQYDGFVLSPGPGVPEQAVQLLPLLQLLMDALPQKPLLGVCLGHQALVQVLGGRIIRGQQPMYGKLSSITHDGLGLFANLPEKLTVTRYHALIAEKESLPENLKISSLSEDQVIMGVRHLSLPYESVQFHPEAELSQFGRAMI